jgi:glycosyltransferase involved in cell wall biosynthesis
MIQTVQAFGQKAAFKLRARLNPGGFLAPVENFFRRRGAPRGRALLVYRALPFHLSPSHPAFNFHQSMIQSHLIAEALDQLGFLVDIVDHSKPLDPPHESYDIVICHNSEADPALPQFTRAHKIYLASGTEHKTHNSRQKLRLADFESRMGRYPIELIWDPEDMRWPASADAIFCFGNQAVARTWRERFHCPVLPFQNTALKQIPGISINCQSGAKHFLFLGSRQQLAKGLDLLLEAFAENPGLHLHVCGHHLKDKGFCEAYHDHLFRRENIHSYGWVDVTSRRFLKLASQCAFTISATCAEGSPGSITNAMKLGLIPILSPEAGIDGGNGVILFDDISIVGIESMIRNCAKQDPSRLRELSAEAVQRANRDFTEAAFKQRWIEMITGVLEKSPARSDHRIQHEADH